MYMYMYMNVVHVLNRVAVYMYIHVCIKICCTYSSLMCILVCVHLTALE